MTNGSVATGWLDIVFISIHTADTGFIVTKVGTSNLSFLRAVL